MDVEDSVARIAAAIGEPARARMLFSLLDGRARTSTELAGVAEVSPPTASVHLRRLETERLVSVQAQGKHRYYRLASSEVAGALEGLSVIAGAPSATFTPNTPSRLRAARTCYDHLAGTLGVALHDRLRALELVSAGYEATRAGERAFAALGIDVAATRALRRRFAYGCLDWSERRQHLGGGLAAALCAAAQRRRWIALDLDGRAVRLTALGGRELRARFGIAV